MSLQGRKIEEVMSETGEHGALSSLEVSQSSVSEFSDTETIDYVEDDKKMFYKKCLTLKL